MNEIKEKLMLIYDRLEDVSIQIEQLKNMRFMNTKVSKPENLDEYITEFLRYLHFSIHVSLSAINELGESELLNEKS